MTILLTAATPFEIAPTLAWLDSNAQKEASGLFRLGQVEVFPLLTGLGISATSWHLGRFFALNRVDLAINAGIAGAFDRSLALGEVVQVWSERFGDLGVEETDGRFTDLFELGFWENDGTLLSNNQMVNPSAELQKGILPGVQGARSYGADTHDSPHGLWLAHQDVDRQLIGTRLSRRKRPLGFAELC